MRVLHVTETYASGVASAIDRYVASTPELEHHLLWSAGRAAGAARDPSVGFASVHQLPAGHLARRTAVQARVRHLDPAVVHAHSSFAGVYVRSAVRARPGRVLVYTPHCFAMERRDLPRAVRFLYLTAEVALGANTSIVAACSNGEADRARRATPWVPVVVVPQLAPPTHAPPSTRRQDDPRQELRVVGAGRLGPQKDPTMFATVVEAARRAGLPVTATWIGDGDSGSRRQLVSAGVVVTGWLDRASVQRVMADHQVYLHCAAWEGFPVTLLEAFAVGCTPVVRRTASQGRRAFPLEFATVDAAVELLAALHGQVGRRDHGWSAYLSEHTEERQREALMTSYGVSA